jgi:hypothetical protein
MKVVIQPYPASVSEKPYAHLIPVAHALIEHGNQASRPEIFFLDRDGWRCDLRKPIDFDFLCTTFEFPKTIILSESLDKIFCQNTWVEIKGGVEE